MKVVDTWKQHRIQLNIPSNVEVEKYAKKKDSVRFTSDYCLEVVQNILFQGETTSNKNSQSRLVIMKRPADDSYVGELFIENLSTDESKTEVISSCRFELGGIENAKRYLEQFKELVTEEGRNPTRVSASKSTNINSERLQADDISQGRTSLLNKNFTTTNYNTMYRHVSNVSGNSPSPVLISQPQLRNSSLPPKQFIQYGMRPNVNLITSPPSSPGIQTNNIQLQQFRAPPTDIKTTTVNAPAVNVTSNNFGRQYIISQQGAPISPVTGSLVTGNLANTTIVSTMQLAPIAPAVNVNSPSNVEARRIVQNKLLLRNQFQQQQHLNISLRGITPVQHNQQQMNVSTIPSSNIQSRQTIITRHQTMPGHNLAPSLVSIGASKNSTITSTTATIATINTININGNGSNCNNAGSSNKNTNITDSGNKNNNNNNLRSDNNNDKLVTTISSSPSIIQPPRGNANNSLNLQGQIMIQKYPHKQSQNLSIQAINQPQQQHLQQLKPRVQRSYQASNQLPEHRIRNLGIRQMQRSLQQQQQQQQQQQSPSQQQIQLRYHQHQQ